ncbi:MAG: four helix bundle protein [Candidatus Sungbacteria bacterium]|nr:four helix bundle protein [Candidatus Sungbacteria bacterium]
MNSYKELIVWQKSMELVRKIYLLSGDLPKSETFGLISQMRRAAVSIPSNIAEGFNRRHRKEFSQFISIAFGSGAEIETQLLLAKSLGLVKQKSFEECDALLQEVMKMLNKLITNLK